MYDAELSNSTIRESSYVKEGEKIVPPVLTPVGNIGLAVVSFSNQYV